MMTGLRAEAKAIEERACSTKLFALPKPKWMHCYLRFVGENRAMSLKATPGQERKSLGCLHLATPKANRPEPDRSKDRPRLVPAACL